MKKCRRFALIPARKGSKGLPGKNSRPLGGMPLTLWTATAALHANCFDDVVLSTDDADLAEMLCTQGVRVPFLRPHDLATDTASSIAVAMHAIEQLGWEDDDKLILLQPTSPFRSIEDIIGCIELMERSGAPATVSVCPVDVPLEWYKTLDENGKLSPAVADLPPSSRRQDAKQYVRPNGAIYAIKIAALKHFKSFTPEGTLGFMMPRLRSIDIDTLQDFLLAEQIIARNLLITDGI